MVIPRVKEFQKKNAHGAALRSRFSPIGLDIGSSRIKLLQLEQSGGAISIYRRASVRAPEGCLQGGGCQDRSALAGALQELFKQAGCRRSPVIISLHSQAVNLRRVTLPPLSPQEVGRAMRWEAEKHLPLPAEESVFDYAFLGNRTSEGKRVFEFVLAGAPKAVAESCAEAVMQAGFYPQAIETAPFALSRAVRWCGAFQPHPYLDTLLLIQIGADISDLLVLHRGLYRFHRPLNLGVNHFRREAAKSAPFSPEDLERLLMSTEPLSRRGLTGTAQKLARQAAGSLEFYSYEMDYPEKQGQTLLLCGGGAVIPGLDSYLGNELGLEASRFDPLAPLYLKTGQGGGDTAPGPLFSTALGLALRGWAL